MASLRIPERLREGIVKVAEISDDGFEQLCNALEKAPECRDSRELSAWIGNETPAIHESDRNVLLRSVTAMFRVQRSSDVAPSRFASDLLESLERDASGRMAAVSGNTLKSRIERLLEINSLDVISTKITELKTELERSFCASRVLTDLRPVFGDVDQEPAAMMILHTLQIGYHDGMGKHHEFYVTLDADDIEGLQKSLNRAKKKAVTLTGLIKKAGIKTD